MTNEPEPEAAQQLDHSEKLIDDARNAAPAGLPDTAADDDLDTPSTGAGLPAEEPVTPGPN